MKKKTKTTQPARSSEPFEDFGAALEAREAERTAQRKKERELILAGGVALLAMAEEQRKAFFARRFESYSKALESLVGQGAFPAVDEVRQQLIRELVVMGRELHGSRIAKVQG